MSFVVEIEDKYGRTAIKEYKNGAVDVYDVVDQVQRELKPHPGFRVIGVWQKGSPGKRLSLP